MIFQTGEPGVLPAEFAYRAVVLLDPGVSTDHSAFLDCYRVWIRASIASKCRMDTARIRPRCYIIHAEEDQARRYGLGKTVQSPVPDDYYRHEVRPRKRNPYRIHHRTRRHGLAWSFVRMELSSHRRGLMAPWRWSKYGDDQPKHDRRPLAVLLEPDRLDLRFLHEHERWWHRFDRMPRLWLGAGTVGRLPPTFMRWLDGVLAITPAGHAFADHALDGTPTKAQLIPTDRLLVPAERQAEKKWTYAIADNWDSGGRRTRAPSLARFVLSKLPPGAAFIPQKGDSWPDLAEALDARAYLVLSYAEEMAPYDAVLALAAGATVVGPNLPVWRSLKSIHPRKVLLYPVRQQGNNRCVWNPLDVAAFLKANLKDKRAGSTTTGSMTPRGL